MKGMDIFCASPASTAILSGIERRRDALHRRQSSVPCSSPLPPFSPRPSSDGGKRSKKSSADLRRKSSADVDDLRSRNGSASGRYLLSEHKSLEDHDLHVQHELVPYQSPKTLSYNDSVPARKPSHSNRSRDQVVVLKVAIHCKGCEGKVRKHISKMEGVKSFDIDLATKKVTIIGEVTPLGVLESISKVKRAQLWPSSSQPLTRHFSPSTL